MICKKWIDGEPVFSVETEDEFWKALTTSEAVELTWELGEKIGLMEDDTMSAMPRNNRTTPTPRIAAISQVRLRAFSAAPAGLFLSLPAGINTDDSDPLGTG